MRAVSSRRVVSKPFGFWMSGLRKLAGFNSQEEASQTSGVSLDAIRAIEQGRLPGSAHLLGWLSWLVEQPTVRASPEFGLIVEKIAEAGRAARSLGLVNQPPKAKTFPGKRRRARGSPAGALEQPAATVKRAGRT